MIGIVALSLITPSDVRAAATAKQPAKPACDSSWYEPTMTKVPQGRITVKGQAQPVNLYIENDSEPYKSDMTLSTDSVTRVYRVDVRNGQKYYFIDNDKYVLGNSSIKYEAVPQKVRSCMVDAVSSYNVTTWTAEAKKLKSPLVKLIYLFQRLDEFVDYDYDLYFGTGGDPLSHTANGALANGLAVCDGYATALQLLLTKVGIEAKVIEGTANNGSGKGYEAHAWNLVKLDGLYYHVDPTWGDGYIGQLHYFLQPDQNMKRDHRWNEKTNATSVKYTYLDRIRYGFNFDYVNETYYDIGNNYDYLIYSKKFGDKSGKTAISHSPDGVFGAPQIYNGELYYMEIDGLKKTSLDGSGERIMNEGDRNAVHFIVFNNHIYYSTFGPTEDGSYRSDICKRDIDGSNRVLLNSSARESSLAGFYVYNAGAHSTLYYYTDDHQLVRLDAI
ncbi:hypothetical protein H8B09_20490 [Paenibacillus sp. PR3]|uniref:Transglutaminase-like domain-containing protein n=1 Tax=Paenibacillus terricola TaxID=2763503 RepID=A0ABR8MYX7_9BACL|nr:transglutaminase domain-containing protein [Paenibacillus terricola]MBD3921158.1 hypothetical protein [Paenibacillus terricola]